MKERQQSVDNILASLQERAKELNCIYRIEEILSKETDSLDEAFKQVLLEIPPGWQFTDVCQAKIIYENNVYELEPIENTRWVQRAPIFMQEREVGAVEVYYLEERPSADFGPFLKEEQKLIEMISERLGFYLLHNTLKIMFREWNSAREDLMDKNKGLWRVFLVLLRRTDQKLFMRISRKMLNHLCWSGIEEAQTLLMPYDLDSPSDKTEYIGEINRPREKTTLKKMIALSDKTFKIAADNLSDKEILALLQKWLQEDKSSFLVKALENQESSLSDIEEAVTRFYHLKPEGLSISEFTRKAVSVSMIRRFFTDQLEFINVAKNFVDIGHFHELLQRVIYTPGSHGKLGGKSAGLFVASKILQKFEKEHELFKDIRTPRTWYLASDSLMSFLHYNNLEEIIEQKYKDIDRIRQEYPHIVQVFKNSHFPPEIITGLSAALDEFGDVPLVVRSSSLLEDRLGTAFSGKYISLFLANQGKKEQRLEALIDAVAEVFASTFGPDPIEYRAERGLLDFHEEMGIMIQEVVGQRVGHYYLPACAGVAFSNNEFRWSPRIKRNDGLIRMVPGLGTRAVDRLGDDFPVLIAPGQPGLRANVTIEEIERYSPQNIDVINLQTNTFETITIDSLFTQYGEEYPLIRNVVSKIQDNHIQKPRDLDLDFEENDFVVTFEGLISETPFVTRMKHILDVLQKNMDTPVDIEFACDGKYFYLLQCRPQSFTQNSVPSPIPKDIPLENYVFSADRFISNGKVPDITHVVYVDPEGYSKLSSRKELKEIGRIVGKLNKLLPKRQFILMGPGRWGSRGDVKLGVSVTYSDINNTSVLIEIARKKGNYVPDLSFGTHFFQDLVEAEIRYLPLYPDEEGVQFNDNFLLNSPNMLENILPDAAYYSDVVKVIDVPHTTNGKILRILLNADLDEAAAYLSASSNGADIVDTVEEKIESVSDDHWRWRMRMIRQVALQLDPKRFGVKSVYVIGSTKNATAGPGSDIDIIVHFTGTAKQREELLVWLEGWSLCLGEMNYFRTGYKCEGLLDIHIITNEDIEKKSSYAIKINAVTDAARALPLMGME